MASFWKPGEGRPGAKPSAAKDEVAKAEGDSAASRQTPKNDAKSKLSGKLLGMKFMSRRNDDNAKEVAKLAAAKKDMEWVSATNNDEDSDEEITYMTDIPEPQLFPAGRRSFGGFNPTVEANYSRHVTATKYDVNYAKEAEQEISPEEMVKRLSKYTGLPGRGRPGGPGQGGKKKRSKGGNDNQKAKKQRR